MLSSGDRRDLVCILKTIYIHKQGCIQKGRKLHACDERFFTEASDKLYCEVAAVMEISPIEAEEYILKKCSPSFGAVMFFFNQKDPWDLFPGSLSLSFTQLLHRPMTAALGIFRILLSNRNRIRRRLLLCCSRCRRIREEG